MNENISLSHEDRLIVITGSNGQIGSELCRQYLDVGAKVVGIDLNSTQIPDLVRKNFSYVTLDIRMSALKKSSLSLVPSMF
jgi:nucleoside-diphosphate-sugar epimerase